MTLSNLGDPWASQQHRKQENRKTKQVRGLYFHECNLWILSSSVTCKVEEYEEGAVEEPDSSIAPHPPPAPSLWGWTHAQQEPPPLAHTSASALTYHPIFSPHIPPQPTGPPPSLKPEDLWKGELRKLLDSTCDPKSFRCNDQNIENSIIDRLLWLNPNILPF